MNESDPNQQKSTISPFTLLSDTQWRFVTAMIDNPEFNKAQGARHIGVKPNTVYGWPTYVDDALELARSDIHSAAIAARRAVLLKAVRVKSQLLDHKDPRIRDKAASDIIEWELGRAVSRQEITGADGAALPIAIVKMDVDEL